MNKNYDPKQYWERRLSNHFSLKGVGHIGFNENYNTWLYQRKKRCIESCLGDINNEGKNVMDIGCGTVFFCRVVSRTGSQCLWDRHYKY